MGRLHRAIFFPSTSRFDDNLSSNSLACWMDSTHPDTPSLLDPAIQSCPIMIALIGRICAVWRFSDYPDEGDVDATAHRSSGASDTWEGVLSDGTHRQPSDIAQGLISIGHRLKKRSAANSVRKKRTTF
jgi:hypothetical protein